MAEGDKHLKFGIGGEPPKRLSRVFGFNPGREYRVERLLLLELQVYTTLTNVVRGYLLRLPSD